MASHARVLNVTRGYSMKRSQALRAIDQCCAAWVEEGWSIRDLTLAESIAARNQQAQLREALPLSEIPGLKYQGPAKDACLWDERAELLREAGAFVSRAIQ